MCEVWVFCTWGLTTAANESPCLRMQMSTLLTPIRGGRSTRIYPASSPALRRPRTMVPTPSRGPQVITWWQKGREPWEPRSRVKLFRWNGGWPGVGWKCALLLLLLHRKRSKPQLLSVALCTFQCQRLRFFFFILPFISFHIYIAPYICSRIVSRCFTEAVSFMFLAVLMCVVSLL